MARSEVVWRCSKRGCPNPNYPKRFRPSDTRSRSESAAVQKARRHGFRYHYKKVTVPWKGVSLTLLRNSNGYFDCPCGAKAHARRHTKHMFSLCARIPHPHVNHVDIISPDTDTEDDQSETDDDGEDDFGGSGDDDASGSRIIEIFSRPVRTSSRTRRSARSVSSTSTRVDPSAGPAGSASTKTGQEQSSASSSTVTIHKRKRSEACAVSEESSDSDEDDPEIIALEAELEERREARRRRLRRKLARYDKKGRKH